MNDLFHRMLSFYSIEQVKPIVLYNSKNNQFENLNSFCLQNNQILIPLNSIHFLNTWNLFKNAFYFMNVNEDIQIIQHNDSYIVDIKNDNIYKKVFHYRQSILFVMDEQVFNISETTIKVKNINEVFNKPYIWNIGSLTVHQEGAGNGKTYGIWKSILLNNTNKTFIIITKQHTAKNVIYQELINQIHRKEIHTHNIKEIMEYNTEKQYVIKYKKYNEEYMVVIGTIDSFFFSLTNVDMNSPNIFKSILCDIKLNGCKKMVNGTIKYAQQLITLNEFSQLWIDEVQDLGSDYLFAVCSLIRETKMNVQVVGDILQSLEYDNNFMTYINNINSDDLKVHILSPVNINRRIKTKHMHSQINNLIQFDKYNLPCISINDTLMDYEQSFQIIESPIIYSNDTDTVKVNNYVDKILHYVESEVTIHNYTPADFLFIFPIMKNNVLAFELETKLNNYWLNKFDNIHYVNKLNDFWKQRILKGYNQYVYLHKYQEGRTINTGESIHSTRIMSIRSSKGDGRKVTFVLNCTETSLKLLSNGEINLIYESYLHVAITRANNKIFFALHENNDDIHKRFGKIGMVKYKPNIKNIITIGDIMKFIDKETIINHTDKITNHKETFTNNKNELFNPYIYKCYSILTILNLIKENENYKCSQLKIIMEKIKNIGIKTYTPKNFYTFINEYSSPLDELPILPVCDLSHKDIYKSYCKIIYDTIQKIQAKINTEVIFFPDTIYECFILNYMISLYTYKQYNPITPMELYNFTHDYYNNKKDFDPIKNNCNDLFENIHQYYEDITWNVNKSIEYNGNDYFTLKKKDFPLIGYNENYVFHILFKDDINSLNYYDILIEILLEKFIIYNPKDNHYVLNDKKRYYGKKIKTYVINMKNDNFIHIDCNADIKDYVKQSIINYYKEKSSELFQYMRQIIEYKFSGNINNNVFKYIHSQLKDYPCYILDFFNGLHMNIDNIETIVSDSNLFRTLLEDKLILYCDLFFLNDINGK